MLLRNDAQAALNEVEELCIEAADRFASSAKRSNDIVLGEEFKSLAERHNELALEIAEELRRMDDLPKMPDPDREAAVEVLSAVKEFFSGDAQATMLEELIIAETKLADAANAALKTTTSANVEKLLLKAQALAEAAKQRLATTPAR
ncbi:DUF2383 domain-containing protein [Herbaspirillum sp. GCM10030257]|uniref:DUF2383 domain-containing protein n=1 Tax=Herbaspirillum sp. GCM10030257 TaxID=3273393 RepID=UPI00360631DE